jgi:RimJ/RimL family protein N-acetyltransferase
MLPESIIFRPATLSDAEAVSDVYLASRKHFLPYAPLAHTVSEVREWIATNLIPTTEVTVAIQAGQIVGMVSLSRYETTGWIEHLYLLPQAVGQGIGTQLLALAKTRLGSPIRLYTFQPNAKARRFYERHGFQAIAFGDGSGNEEGCPDVLYEWHE